MTEIHKPHDLILRTGLASMAGCWERTGKWGEGHWGAAVLAGSFFLEENNLEGDCSQTFERQVGLFMERNPDPFVSLPDNGGADGNDTTNPLLAALEGNIDRLCWVGHNVIFASLALKALRRVPELSVVVPGIEGLVALFDRSIPGRSWIGRTVREVQEMEIDETFPTLETPDDVSRWVLEELATFQAILVAESHHDLIGHLLDFSQAVNLLHDLGYESLFHRALRPLRQFVTVLRSSQKLSSGQTVTVTSPVDRPPLIEAQSLNEGPLTAQYWKRDFSHNNWDGGHTFKFPYSYYDHAKRVPEELSVRSRENFLKILGGSYGPARPSADSEGRSVS